MNHFRLLLAIALLWLPPVQSLAQPPTEPTFKIGYVNMNSAVNASLEGKRSKERLEVMAQAMKRELQGREVQLREKEEALRDAAQLTPAERSAREREIMRLRSELRAAVKRSQKEFREQEGRFNDRITRGLAAVIDAIAKREGYDLVVDSTLRQGIYFTKYEVVDLTRQVVEAFDRKPVSR